MAMRAHWVWLLALGVGAGAAANCSKEEEGPPPSSALKPTKALCKAPKKLEVTGLAATDQPGVLQGKAKSSDGKSWTLRVELSDREDFKHKPGSYSLAEQESYDGCRQCVVAFEGESLVGASKQLFQSNGTLKLETVTSPPSAISKGTLEKVELREVTIDSESAAVSEVSGGGCYQISSYSWDTTPEPDTKCKTAADCGDPETVACDPRTGMCVAFQCEVDTNKGCDADKEICLSQEIGASYGSCYSTCTPFSSEEACPAGLECVALDANQAQGKCLEPGAGAEGAACEPSPIETGCAPGLVCEGAGEGQACRKVCDFFGGSAGCGAGQRCVFGGYCTDEPGDAAALGAGCSSFEGAACGAEGGVFRGICADVEGALVCRAPCRVGSVFRDCDEGFVCVIGGGEAAVPLCQAKSSDEVAP